MEWLISGRGVLSALPDSLMAMPDKVPRQLDWFLAYQAEVVQRAQIVSAGLSEGWLRHRIAPGGPWQRLLPGVYLSTTGQPTQRQLQIAAVLYAGPGSVVTGAAALENYRIRVGESRRVDLLVPASRKRASWQYVAIHRTSRMPQSLTCDGALTFAPVARAVADTIRGCGGKIDLAAARAIVAGAVQKGLCTLPALASELAAGQVRGSAQLRSILAEVADGIRSPAEGDFRVLLRRSALPKPLFNPQLVLNGQFLASPDAWWPDVAVAAEIDSREWHLSPADWEQTMRRHDRMTAAGIRVLHFSPGQIRSEPGRILQDIAGALSTGQPIPGLVTRPGS